MTSGGEQFGNACRVEAGFRETEGSSQARATGADNNSIVFVVLYRDKKVSRSEWMVCIGASRRRRTITGYFVLTKGDASLARSGRFANIFAVRRLYEYMYRGRGQGRSRFDCRGKRRSYLRMEWWRMFFPGSSGGARTV